MVDPKSVDKLSFITGSPNSRLKRMVEQNCTFTSKIRIRGNWDQNNNRVISYMCGVDFKAFLEGKPRVVPYDWENLFESMQTKGYTQDPGGRYVEIGIGRTGEYFLADGRHRLLIAQYLNIELIPVEVVYIHELYDNT